MLKFLRSKIVYIVFPCLLLLFFNKIFFGHAIFVTGDFSGSDLLDLHYPFKAILHQMLSKGILPIWESRLSLGFPLLAEGQSGILFPVNIILSFLRPALALNYSIIFVFCFSFAGSYWYLRLLNHSKSASLFGSIAFAFSAFFIARFKHLNLVNVASLFPLLLCTTKLYFEKNKLTYAVGSGIIMAAMFLAGHPQMAFYCLFIFLFYTIFECSKEPLAASFSKTIIFLTTAAFFTATLSAIQLIPTAELIQFTPRQEFSEKIITAYPFNLQNLIGLISPYYFGNPAVGTYNKDIHQIGVFWENAIYIGLLPLFLALYGLYRLIRFSPRQKYSLFFGLLALFSLLLMLGGNTPLFMALAKTVPLFGLFRFPTRFNLFFIFSLVVLASQMFDFIQATLSPHQKKMFISASFLFLIFDLAVFANAYIGYLPLSTFEEVPKTVQKIAQDTTHYRIYSLTQYDQSPYALLGWKTNPDSLLAIRQAIAPNNNVLVNLSSFNDRAWFEGGLSLARRNKLENFILKENTNPAITGKILGMYNVKYLLSFSEQLGIEIEKIDEYNLGKEYASTLKLFENKQVMSRVIFVPEVEVYSNENALFKRLTSLDFLPTRTVLLEKQPHVLPPQFAGTLETFQKENPVSVKNYSDTEVIIEATIKDHGFLVLSDIFYPGWKATVDGKSEEILQADYLVRSIELDPGEHTIRFYYDPLSIKVGAVVSLFSFSFLCIISACTAGRALFKKVRHNQKKE